MPRRNRVDPWGDLHAVEATGLFTGNRGCLVDDERRIVRHHQGSLWITCVLEFQGRRHELDAPRRWTPLFFLDEAVAFAAGHRPCGECRRGDYVVYRDAVTAASGADAPMSAGEMNRRLAEERLRPGRGFARAGDRVLYPAILGELPAGAVVVERGGREPHLVGTGGLVQPFGFAGWGKPAEWRHDVEFDVLTPPLSLAALRHGYTPRLHPTAA